MLWLVMLTVMWGEPSPHLRSKAEIRNTMNRIDDLSLASLDALSHKIALENVSLGNKERYERVKFLLYIFAKDKLDISFPMNDIEKVVIEDLAKKATKKYDRPDVIPPRPQLPIIHLQIHTNPIPKPNLGTFEQLTQHYPVMRGQKGWYNTKDYGVVWGWQNSDGRIIFSQQEQPPKNITVQLKTAQQMIYLQPSTIQLIPIRSGH